MDVAPILRHYPAPYHGVAVALGNHGGFSGARLWRVEAPTGHFCLRAWPEGVAAAHLHLINALIRRARAAGLSFVPETIPTRDGEPFVAHGQRFWELTTWLPGSADFRDDSSPDRMRAACEAIARLHLAWAEAQPRHDVCPAALRRLRAVERWPDLLTHGWRPDATAADPVRPWAERAVPLLRRHLPDVPRRLARWLDKPLPVQPCLCDVWHDHVLFTGGRVTGLVDYGSVKVDHVACDLARWLGSTAGDDATLRAAGVAAYRQVRPLTDEECELIDDLEHTGLIVAVANWLRWLYLERRPYADREAVARRLSGLVRLLEGA